MAFKGDAFPDGLRDAVDEVRATVLTLLATLQEEERTLRHRASAEPCEGVHRGLRDVYAIRAWADKTLHTLDNLNDGDTEDLAELIDELGEFSRIVESD